tara:strand:+ start:11388 stop:11636 length:249 start_codon:yes stop_codon:yes gene_type:complete
MDIEQRAKRSKSLLENDWFVKTIENLREHQKNVFANSMASEIEAREDAHSMIRALNAIQRELQADIDALTLFKGKGKHRGND